MGENIEDRIEADTKRRKKLNRKGLSENPEKIEKIDFFADEKREKYVKEGFDDTGTPWQG